MSSSRTAILLALAVVLIVAAPAYAYLDPVSGSIILQVVLGGIAGALVLIRVYFRRLMGFLGLGKSAEEHTDDSQ